MRWSIPGVIWENKFVESHYLESQVGGASSRADIGKRALPGQEAITELVFTGRTSGR